jgi:kinesin family protein 2/24
MTTTDFSALLAGFKPTPAKPNVAGEGERGGTRVVVRIRPTEGDDADPQAVFGRESGPAGEAGAAAAASTATTVDVHEVRKSVRGDVALQTATFSLDAVYGASATTEELYAAQIAPLVPWAWNGGVATVFAYGQTGSGKTFTIAAIERLVAHDLFDGVGEGKRNVFLTVVELAGNVACGEY